MAEELIESTRAAPPSHFKFKIESFSSLSTSSLKRFESCEFDAGGYKWKLAFYPNGNKSRDGKDHISLYLVLADKSCLTINKEILVIFSLFAYDHIKDKYFMVQQLSRFHATKFEAGLNKFFSLEFFKDPSNGYLVDDTCLFGAEVFVINCMATKGQCLSMMAKKPVPFKYTWEIQKFSELEDKAYYSDKFRIGDHDWKIQIYPKGYSTARGISLSMYLCLADSKALLPAGREVVVEYTLRVVNQVNQNHKEWETTACFSATNIDWGLHDFLKLSNLNKSTGYLVKDVCVVEAEVIVLGSAKNWD